MFVQVITGTVVDQDAFQRQVERWEKECRPGATGFLGATSGLTADGRFIVVARFASEDDARANSDRPEQGAWWAETEKTVDDVRFDDSVEVKTMFGGGTDDAGFVQVMRGRVLDEAKAASMEAKMRELEPEMRAFRPDVIGEVIVVHGDDTFTDVVYFTSETAARAGETSPPPPEVDSAFADMAEAIAIDEYLDLAHPWLT